jgi:hypothetical protein
VGKVAGWFYAGLNLGHTSPLFTFQCFLLEAAIEDPGNCFNKLLQGVCKKV